MIRPRDLVPPALRAAEAAAKRGDMRIATTIAGFAQDMADLQQEIDDTPPDPPAAPAVALAPPKDHAA